MATSIMSEGVKLLDSVQYRELMYQQSKPRLQHLAWHAQNLLGKRNNEFVVACVQVDSGWRDVADELLPDYDWQPIRNQGEDPLANGLALWGLCHIVAARIPNIAAQVLKAPMEGRVKILVLSEHYGASLYELEPKRDISYLN